MFRIKCTGSIFASVIWILRCIKDALVNAPSGRLIIEILRVESVFAIARICTCTLVHARCISFCVRLKAASDRAMHDQSFPCDFCFFFGGVHLASETFDYELLAKWKVSSKGYPRCVIRIIYVARDRETTLDHISYFNINIHVKY